MKLALTLALALAAMAVAAVGVHQLGFSNVRIEVPAAVILYLCLSGDTFMGALGSFAVGYLFDLMTGHPTGLYTFVAMLTFVLCRVVVIAVDVRGPWGFGAFAALVDAAFQLLAYAMLALFAGHVGGPPHAALAALVPTALLSGLLGMALLPAFHRLDLAFDREETRLSR